MSNQPLIYPDFDETTNRTPKKKGKKKWVTVVKVIVAIPLLYFVFITLKAMFYPRLYFGPRIKGTVELVIDGQPYALTEDCIHTNERFLRVANDSCTVKCNIDGSAYVKIGGGYGKYGYVIDVEELEYPVYVTTYQMNSWETTDYDLVISVDTEAGTVSYEGTYSRNGSWTKHPYSFTVDAAEGDTMRIVGPG